MGHLGWAGRQLSPNVAWLTYHACATVDCLVASAPMPLTATLVDPLTEPTPAGWDDFVRAQGLLPVWDSELLRTADWCAQTPSSMVLVQEARSAEPVAAFHVRHLGVGNPTRFVSPGRIPAASVTECRTAPATTGAGLVFAAATGERDRIEAVRVFERAVRGRAGPGGLAMAYRHLLTPDLAVVPSGGRVRLRVSPLMVLYNEWPDLMSYLASLPRKWRSQLAKIHDTVRADRTVRVEVATSIDAGEACWLTEVVRTRYAIRGVRRPPLPSRYFVQLGRLTGARFLTYREPQGRLVGFTAIHDNGDELMLIAWGSRGETDGRRGDLYFDQYLRAIDMMISTGRRRLVLGPAMQRIKERYGARPEPRWGLVGVP